MCDFKKWDKKVKKLKTCDIGLIKLSVVAFTLFLITVWPELLNLILKVHWGWYLAIAIIAAYCPTKKFFS